VAEYEKIIKKEPKIYPSAIKDDIMARRDPDFFWPTGTQVYIGRQGSGKTISAVRHLIALRKKYPKAKVVSNLLLNDIKALPFKDGKELALINEKMDTKRHYVRFNTMEQLALALTGINNGKLGVIYIIDEIHTYFNALDSKNIPPWVFTEISQQRKQRKLIVGTSQLFMRMAKPFREQVDNMIVCRSFMGVLTLQRAFDGETLDVDEQGKLQGDIKRRGFFFQSPKLRSAYDTYQKVVSSDIQLAQETFTPRR